MLEAKTLEQIKTVTASYLEKQHLVACAYLFGSHARGNSRLKSDVDIAVLFFPGYSKSERFDCLLQMGIDMEKLLGCKVDLVDLSTASVTLCHQVMKHRICLVNKDQRLRVEFEVEARRKYFDLKPALDRRTEALLRNL